MNARISAMMCLLCVLGSADLTRADDPYSQRVADPYALSPDPPTMSSGTLELYMSFLSGIAMTRSADATFTDGTLPTMINDVDYRNNFAVGGNLGVWFPTRNKLWGFDLGMELNGFVWQADVAFGRDNFNQDPVTGAGTTTEIHGLYIGPNFLIRYPLAISEAYPNGRWFPYVGIGVGMHQMAMRPGGSLGVSAFCCAPGGNLNVNSLPDQRDTTHGWLAMAGIKGHLFKYVAAFVEAKYIQAHHDGLLTDRFGQSFLTFPGTADPPNNLFLNQYSSSINSIHVHAGLSIHFDWRP
jgi:opacity protein-like surface antigen